MAYYTDRRWTSHLQDIPGTKVASLFFVLDGSKLGPLGIRIKKSKLTEDMDGRSAGCWDFIFKSRSEAEAARRVNTLKIARFRFKDGKGVRSKFKGALDKNEK